MTAVIARDQTRRQTLGMVGLGAHAQHAPLHEALHLVLLDQKVLVRASLSHFLNVFKIYYKIVELERKKKKT